jgi:hypothetical protein
MNALPVAITSEALFYGKAPSSAKAENSVSAEVFWNRMNDIRVSQNLTEPQAIVRAVGNLRESARFWWDEYIRRPLSRVDQTRIVAEWNYFTEQFKKQYYKVLDIADTTADIADITPLDGERVNDYIMRLAASLGPVSEKSVAHTKHMLDQADPEAYAPQNFQDYLTDPAAHPLNLDARTAALRTTILRALYSGCDTRELHVNYEHVLRIATRNWRDGKMQRFLRKHMFRDDRNLSNIMDAARAEEKSIKGNRFTSSKGAAVAAVEDDAIDAPYAGDESALVPLDSEDDGEDSVMGIYEVCAVTKRPVFVPKTRRKFLGKGKGRGRGQPSRFPAGPPRPSNEKPNTAFKCPVCRADSHGLQDCRKTRSLGYTVTFDPANVTSGNRPAHPYGGGKGRGRGRKKQQQQQEEPMDTGSASSVQQQQQPTRYEDAAALGATYYNYNCPPSFAPASGN